MIGICTKCGNHQWDKEVKGDEICCPKCGNSWKFIKLPLFILTGCSGIGKTTTAMEIIRRKAEFTVLDGDMFYNIMPHETEEDYYDQVEQIGSLSKNLMQTGLPVLWTMAGNLDKLPKTYNSRFFREIYCLALALQNYDGVESVDFATVWGQQHVKAERTGNSTDNFIVWVNECMR